MTDKKTFNEAFEKLFRKKGEIKPEYDLPIRWNGEDFQLELSKKLRSYQKDVDTFLEASNPPDRSDIQQDIKDVCYGILWAADAHFRGLPEQAYVEIKQVMERLQEDLLTVERETLRGLPLYRAVRVPEGTTHDRKRVFHVPFNKQSRMATTRYSIPGFPSLYLGTSLELCCRETDIDPQRDLALAARFKLDMKEEGSKHADDDGRLRFDNGRVRIIDLGIKPNDLFMTGASTFKGDQRRFKPEEYKRFQKGSFRKIYLRWYPLIAACSFIRARRDDPFAQEYVIPQLVLQWLESFDPDSLVGIRYFSSYSRRFSEMGFNYVFPSLGASHQPVKTVENYCPRLAHRFRLSEPRFTQEFPNLEECVKELADEKDDKLLYIEDWSKTDERPDNKEYEVGDSVTAIGVYAFQNWTKLEKVKIPDSVTSIGYGAFEGCAALPSITIPNSVRRIGPRAFLNCESLTGIRIPKNVRSIGEGAFADCDQLKKITVEHENKAYHISNGCLIGDEDGKLLWAKKDLEGIKVPERVKEIGEMAFYNHKCLSGIEIPNALTRIGEYAFWNCERLESIKNLDIVTSIGRWAFAFCNSLKSPKVSNRVKSIERGTFAYCKNLTSITIPESVTSIGDMAFFGCEKLTRIVIPESVTSIGRGAFAGCNNLTIYCRAAEQPEGWHPDWKPGRVEAKFDYTGK